MLRRLLLVLPALAAGIVLWAVLSTGWRAPVRVARVFGGPTPGAQVLAWQLSVQRLHEERREPSAGLGVRLLVDTGSERALWTGTTDAAGRVEARVPLSAPLQHPADVRVETSDGELLAEGRVELDDESWRESVRRQGGELPGRQQGELWVLVRPREGTLAVPFASELSIQVTHGPILELPRGSFQGHRGVAGVELELELTGAELIDPERPLRTDERGQARVGLRPLEHAISMRVGARLPADAPTPKAGDFPLDFVPGRAGDPRSGEWQGALPVMPGALHAALDGAQLLVRSPIPRDQAYVSLIDGRHRVAGYIVALQPDDEGGARGSVLLEPELLSPRTRELYAVVSSEPDKRSASAVGWQLLPAPSASPALTFDVADQLLLDGSQEAVQRERETRLARRRVAAALLALVGVAMIGVFSLEARRSAQRAAAAPTELALGSQRGWLALALGCLLLGIGALAYFGLLQR